jgi:adenine/guanine phosphoribosyltransferase-like PRPP-binding protein
MEFLVLAVLVAAVTAGGLVLGMLLARRLDRWLVDRDETPRDEPDEPDESD